MTRAWPASDDQWLRANFEHVSDDVLRARFPGYPIATIRVRARLELGCSTHRRRALLLPVDSDAWAPGAEVRHISPRHHGEIERGLVAWDCGSALIEVEDYYSGERRWVRRASYVRVEQEEITDGLEATSAPEGAATDHLQRAQPVLGQDALPIV